MSDKPIGIVVASWNPNEPRFVVADATEYLSDDKKFVNGKCVKNQRLKIVYSVEDIVEVLNDYEEFEKEYKKLEKENEQLRKELGDCEKFRYQVFKRMNDEYIKECSIR